MADFLLQLSKNKDAKKIVKTLGLPIPMPEDLKRPKGAASEQPLFDVDVALRVATDSALAPAIAEALIPAGANLWMVGDQTGFASAAEAFARPIRDLDLEGEPRDLPRFGGIVFDASGFRSPDDLRKVYDFFHPLARNINKLGRVLIIGRTLESGDILTDTVQQALDGFVRSLAKEVGKRGATAQLLRVPPGAELNAVGPIRFFLSRRSAYITGQTLTLSPTKDAATLSPTRPLAGKVALVTGAARGIGAATAARLAEEGAHVVLLDRPQDDGPTSKVAKSIGGTPLFVDITSDEAADDIATFLKEEFGGVDIVVHNAGITRDKTIARMKPEWWDQTIDVNLSAVAKITQHLLQEKVLNKGGRLICLSSIAGIAGNMGQTNYASAKAGIIGFVRAIAPSVAKSGSTINAVAPGFIETRMTDAIPAAIREVARRMNNLGQGGRPVDVAEAVLFYARPGSAGVNGQVLRVCGGSLVGQ